MTQLESPIAREALSSKLAESVLQLIQQEQLEAGDRLPTVKALAERFGVATPTIREALRGLEAMGMITIRHGSGTYVHTRATTLMLVNPYAKDLDLETVLELLDARLVIEPALAEMAAKRLTPEDVSELEAILAEVDAQAKQPPIEPEVVHKANRLFHDKIARCAQNKILGQTAISLHDLYLKEQIEIFYLYDDPLDDHRQHHAILDALRERAPERARAMMASHLARVRQVVEERHREKAG